jgi:hypothetical protein
VLTRLLASSSRDQQRALNISIVAYNERFVINWNRHSLNAEDKLFDLMFDRGKLEDCCSKRQRAIFPRFVYESVESSCSKMLAVRHAHLLVPECV